MDQLCTNRTEIRRSPIHGWGLFAGRPLRVGETINETPLALVAPVDAEGLLDRFYELDDETWGLPTGDGAVVNSSDNPNADFYFVTHGVDTISGACALVRLVAKRDIWDGEEITIRYAS